MGSRAHEQVGTGHLAITFVGLVFTGWVNAQEVNVSLTLTSTAFGAGDDIPAKYTCEGADVSPPLTWQNVPLGVQSLALIMDDPDAPDPAAPRTTWVHWVVFDIPPIATGLPEDANQRGLPAGSRAGLNDWQRQEYGGPCPPIGRHRYFFKLYALDETMSDLDRPTKKDLEQAMKGHILAATELIGTYRKGRGTER